MSVILEWITAAPMPIVMTPLVATSVLAGWDILVMALPVKVSFIHQLIFREVTIMLMLATNYSEMRLYILALCVCLQMLMSVIVTPVILRLIAIILLEVSRVHVVLGSLEME